MDSKAIRIPDISARPHDLIVDRDFATTPAILYQAWTTGFDRWFAAPGAVLMRPETIPDQLVELTWVTGAGVTGGAETIVTVELHVGGHLTRLTLTHTGFADEASRNRHRPAWPLVLAQLNQRLVVSAGGL
jgi:uncharacterized protein YndB with AHSA1/START domain